MTAYSGGSAERASASLRRYSRETAPTNSTSAPNRAWLAGSTVRPGTPERAHELRRVRHADQGVVNAAFHTRLVHAESLALACGSRSIKVVLAPFMAKPTAKLTAVVVFQLRPSDS